MQDRNRTNGGRWSGESSSARCGFTCGHAGDSGIVDEPRPDHGGDTRFGGTIEAKNAAGRALLNTTYKQAGVDACEARVCDVSTEHVQFDEPVQLCSRRCMYERR